ncbi:hypothetical protein Bbelb_090700 [Branchiostoma belcheri]|nr:hypothetical protein Bbelb_090700 [Branchiostoma belcheri]
MKFQELSNLSLAESHGDLTLTYTERQSTSDRQIPDRLKAVMDGGLRLKVELHTAVVPFILPFRSAGQILMVGHKSWLCRPPRRLAFRLGLPGDICESVIEKLHKLRSCRLHGPNQMNGSPNNRLMRFGSLGEKVGRTALSAPQRPPQALLRGGAAIPLSPIISFCPNALHSPSFLQDEVWATQTEGFQTTLFDPTLSHCEDGTSQSPLTPKLDLPGTFDPHCRWDHVFD